MSNALLIQ